MADRDLGSGIFSVWGQSSGISSRNHSSTEKPQRKPYKPQLLAHTHGHAQSTVTKGQQGYHSAPALWTVWELHSFDIYVCISMFEVYLSIESLGLSWGDEAVQNVIASDHMSHHQLG